jgi:glycerol uptake facilitator protein
MASLLRRCVAEAVGTGFIVLFVTGSISCQIAFGAHEGLLQMALISGLGVALAIMSTVAVSGAHLNPAVSLTLALLRGDKFPARELPAYVVSQFLGGFLGSAVVFASLGGAVLRQDELRGIKPGDAASLGTAAAFGDYFHAELMGPLGAFAIEALGTGIMMFMIFAATDERNPTRPSSGATPFVVGMTVTVLISLFAPLTMAGWNPARDLGPRIVAMLVGYGQLAFQEGFWAYLLGPCFGAPIGGLLYDHLIAPGLPHASEEQSSMDPEACQSVCCADQAADQAALPNLLGKNIFSTAGKQKVVCEPNHDVTVVVEMTDKEDTMYSTC